MNYGDSHTTDPMTTRLQGFKDNDYQIVSIVLEARKEIRLHRCRNDPRRNPFDKIDEMFFHHDSETFERLQDDIFQKKSETALSTENKSPSQVAHEILCHLD